MPLSVSSNRSPFRPRQPRFTCCSLHLLARTHAVAPLPAAQSSQVHRCSADFVALLLSTNSCHFSPSFDQCNTHIPVPSLILHYSYTNRSASGRRFFTGIYTVPSLNANSFSNKMAKHKHRHVRRQETIVQVIYKTAAKVRRLLHS